MRPRAVLIAVVLCSVVGPAQSHAVTLESSATLDPFGRVELYRESDRPARVVLLLSDADGWNRRDVESARAIAGLDALVVGIDLARYLATMGERGGELYPSADLEVLSQFIQKKSRLPTYVPPIVVGHGAGATMAYAAAAQARPNSLGGAVSLGFCPTIATPVALGAGTGLRLVAGTVAGRSRLLPAPALAAPWTAVQATSPPGDCDANAARPFVDAAPGSVLLELATQGATDDPEHWLPSVRGVLDHLSPPRSAPAAAATSESDVGDLPLVEVPATGTPRALAVILSGDGGWASLDREVGDALAAAGVGVVGLSSLSYFWTKRTPEGAAADLTRILRHYREAWRTPHALLVGYSRGADVLPFLASRLPAEERARVQLVALLGPGRTTDFEFHLTDWLGGDDPSALPLAPEVAKLRGLRVLCVQGADEDDSLCPLLDAAAVRRFVLPGGHHFGGDYDVIASRILAEAAVPRQASSSPSP